MVIYATWESSTDREDFDLLQTFPIPFPIPRKPRVNTDNLASQEKIVVNGRHILCGQRYVDLYMLKEIGVLTQHCLTVFKVQGFLV